MATPLPFLAFGRWRGPRAGVVALGLGLTAIAGSSCSTSFRPKACERDADCGAGFACVGDGAATCLAAADAPLRVGLSAPLSGPSQSLGVEMRKGIVVAFEEQNAAGGVRGRRVELDSRDDQYIPQAAEAAVRELLDVYETDLPPRCPTTATPLTAGESPVSAKALGRGPNGVFALLGNVGTPTMVRTAPIAVETGTLFFGPFTGASTMLRDGTAQGCSRYIFNVRASYAQEARATAEFFKRRGVPDAAHVVSFDQNDSFGQAGYNGLVSALQALGFAAPPGSSAVEPGARFRYERDEEASVPAQIELATKYLQDLLDGSPGAHVVGVFMTDTYGPATQFIQGVRVWQYDAGLQSDKATRLRLIFSNVSFVGPDELARRLKEAGAIASAEGSRPLTDGVYVSQVVPNYLTDNSDAVRIYRDALRKRNLPPSFTSLEGYVAARVFLAGLLASAASSSTDALIEALETMPPVPLGLGPNARFDANNHQYSKSVWGTALGADGAFVDTYVWTDGTPLQLFE
jgi:ABC-type branched-subunit amino acid transport system substrate-binding protein